MPNSTPMPERDALLDDRGWLRRLLVFGLIAVGLVAASRLTPLREWFRSDTLSAFVAHLGPWGPAAIFAIGAGSPLLFLPRWPIALVAGMLYGMGWGGLLANTASTLGAWLHFHLARGLLFPAADRLRRRYRLRAVGQLPERELFVVLFLLRAFPLSNFVVTNLLAGAFKIRTRVYLSATFLGMIPSTLMYAALGKAVQQPSNKLHLALAFGLLLTLTAGAWFAARRLRRVLRWRDPKPPLRALSPDLNGTALRPASDDCAAAHRGRFALPAKSMRRMVGRGVSPSRGLKQEPVAADVSTTPQEP